MLFFPQKELPHLYLSGLHVCIKIHKQTIKMFYWVTDIGAKSDCVSVVLSQKKSLGPHEYLCQ